jgi:hypothetical protein
MDLLRVTQVGVIDGLADSHEFEESVGQLHLASSLCETHFIELLLNDGFCLFQDLFLVHNDPLGLLEVLATGRSVLVTTPSCHLAVLGCSASSLQLGCDLLALLHPASLLSFMTRACPS